MTEQTVGTVRARVRGTSRGLALALALAMSLSSTSACASEAAPSVAAAPAASGTASASTEQNSKVIGRKRIVKVALDLEVREPAKARRALEQELVRVGGFVESLRAYGSGQQASYELVARVPEPKLEATLTAVRGLGHATGESQDSTDVTREYVDTDARLRNLQRTEERLLALLGQSSGSLNDVLAVERELSRVRGEAEQLTSQLRALDHDVALATLTVDLRAEHDVVSAPDDAFASLRTLGVDAPGVMAHSVALLSSFVGLFVRTFLALLPWVPVLALGWWMLRKLRLTRLFRLRKSA